MLALSSLAWAVESINSRGSFAGAVNVPREMKLFGPRCGVDWTQVVNRENRGYEPQSSVSPAWATVRVLALRAWVGWRRPDETLFLKSLQRLLVSKGRIFCGRALQDELIYDTYATLSDKSCGFLLPFKCFLRAWAAHPRK